MSNFKRDGVIWPSRNIQKSGRLGRITRFEYINRAGEKVNPKTGKPITSRLGNIKYTNGKPINARLGIIKSANGKPMNLKSGNARVINGKSITLNSMNSRRANGKPIGGFPIISTENLKKKKRQFPIKRTGALFGGLDPIPTNPKVDPPPRTCYNCWQLGHSRRSCPRPIVALFCINCGRRGEDLTSCPRCKRAHSEYLLQHGGNGIEDVEINEQDQLFSLEGFESDEEDCDEVLNELIYQDEKAREMMAREAQNENTNLPVTHPTKPMRGRRFNKNGATPYEHNRRKSQPPRNRRTPSRETGSSYLQREKDESISNYFGRNGQGGGGFFIIGKKANANAPNFKRERTSRGSEMGDYNEIDRERKTPSVFERNREIEIPLNDQREQYDDIPSLKEPRSKSSEREFSRYDHVDRERERAPSRNSMYRERNGRSDSVTEHLDEDVKNIDSNSVTPEDADPVHDVLMLAKSISHLSSDTQDLIMRQVMAERKEKAQNRASNEINDSVW